MPLENRLETNDFYSTPTDLDFKVGFMPSRVGHKKYVFNKNTGEYLDVVGHGFNCVSHKSFFDNVKKTMLGTTGRELLENSKIKWSSARNNAWAMLDINMVGYSRNVSNDKFSTSLTPRIIALHAIDGSASNQVYFGAIDSFCTNGMISGDYSMIRRKNTSGFSIDKFIRELSTMKGQFINKVAIMNEWANKQIPFSVDVKTLLEDIVKSERKADRMYLLYQNERQTRGENVFALYSAFTNYSSYADERNGFALRNTGLDTRATSMWAREQEVAKWIDSPKFKELLVA